MSAPRVTGDRMVFEVPSATKPGTNYRCDLLANNGAGFCGCIDFATRRQPAIDAGAESWTRATTCRHLRSSARFFMRDVLKAMALSESTPPQK